MTLVLRKSWHKYSPGTPVTELPNSRHYDNYMGGQATHVTYADGEEDTILLSYITERRPATDMIPAKTRKMRRSEIIATKRIMAQLTAKEDTTSGT